MNQVAEKLSEPMPLHIPQGINYECTGCGKCCGGWSVPLTGEDYDRIAAIDWTERKDKFASMDLFRELPDHDQKTGPYTHSIKVGDDGHCPFLVDNLCFIHSQFESKTKPSICQLFPYCFNETPSGIYASISFVSWGAVKNAGRPLTEQADYLQTKLSEFRSLYPDHHPNWSSIEFVKQMPMSWEDYLGHEEKIFAYLGERQVPLKERLARTSIYLNNFYRTQRGLKEAEEALPSLEPGSRQLKADDIRLFDHPAPPLFPPEATDQGGDSNFSAVSFVLGWFSPEQCWPRLSARASSN